MTYIELEKMIETSDGAPVSTRELVNTISEASVKGLITDEENDKLIEQLRAKL